MLNQKVSRHSDGTFCDLKWCVKSEQNFSQCKKKRSFTVPVTHFVWLGQTRGQTRVDFRSRGRYLCQREDAVKAHFFNCIRRMPVSYCCTAHREEVAINYSFLFSFQLSEAARNRQTRRFSQWVVCGGKKQVLCYWVLIPSHLFIFTMAAKELSAAQLGTNENSGAAVGLDVRGDVWLWK